MKPYATSAQLKARARGQLLGHYLPFSLAFILLAILHSIITAPSGLLLLPQPWNLICYYAADFAITLFFAIFEAGLAFLFLANACRKPVGAMGLFAGFAYGPGKAVSIWLVPALYLFLPSFLPNLFLARCLAAQDFRWAIGAFLVWALFLPAVLYIRILYSQVFYIMLDYPDMSAAECRRYSIRLMKGHKGRYLHLMLSFLPLWLLCLLTFGIGFLYYLPYREQSYADFYLDLIDRRERDRKPF